jgi:37-kD nucleoid-associated bacterial protein
MSAKIEFSSATVTRLVLAKIGHPQRDEALQTSKQVFEVSGEDQQTLTPLFLKPFRNLDGHRFSHHAALDQHEMNTLSKAVFASADGLLEHCQSMARRLYSKSNHPNIKSGDLCISLIEDIRAGDERVQGICILKSESVVPFLSISDRDGDLRLHTAQGINPEKIDKGCLILNHLSQKGFHVLTFDRSGTDSRFWVRDFLGLVPITDSPFLTNKYADMAVAFVKREEKEKQPAEAGDDGPPWQAGAAAGDALAYFEGREKFSLQEFEEQFLRTPDAVSRFRQHKAAVEEETGQSFDDEFDISQKHLSKARKHTDILMRLDTGVEIRVKAAKGGSPQASLEHGFDSEKGMKFIKVFFNKELSS